MLSYENRPAMGQPTTAASDHLPINTPSTTGITNGTSTSKSQPETKHSHIWLITGPAGCGKSTVAAYIAKAMSLPYIEGDEFHPEANVKKMSEGIPLTDADRWDWLTQLREEAVKRIASGSQGVVVTCSALKRKYRDVIRVAPYYSHDVLVHFIYLHAREEVLVARVGARKGHYMPASMVHSQFGILEAPGKDETDVISVDVSGTLEEVEQDALAKIRDAVKAELVMDS
ncbi:P-loop containing nucleoside triphosphate hydrolase [Glarea lozoyensis ATCC 20868]|uniref:Gluconokinase n=2 Tax=Glarea lozoyensis TaxID=101852 RepID=S3DHR4_GLAL2|nr:P-loop containing nucleoside triphosphate hydrolase [Glarea lozoyensis ATCC 20868]EPE31581.1 P-loop containing nucleoside triphosphate hydrolase [Glarea lozoyensis ATCC 20868]